MLDLRAELGDLVDVVPGFLAEQLDVVRLVLGEVIEQADRVGFQVREGLRILVDADDEARLGFIAIGVT